SRTANFNLGGGTAAPLLFDSRQIELLGSTGASAFISNNNATPTNTITINTDLLVTSTGPKTLTLGGGNTGTNTFGGVIADAAGSVISLTKAGAGTWILSGANTYTGTTTVSGGTLVLAPSGGLTFKPTDTTSNKVTGGAAAVFDGSFNIDTSAVTATGSWTLVDVTTKTYGATFSVTGYSGPVGYVWTKVDGARTWTFDTSTGVLGASGPALITSFSIPGYSGVIDNNAMTIVLHLPAGTDLATLAPDFTLSSGTCNQTSGSPPSPTFAARNPATYTVADGTTVNQYAVTVTLPAPISYGLTGTGTLAFDTPPETSQWTTASIAGGGGDIGDLTAMDNTVNALAASGITAPLAEIVGNPTATMPLGKWNSTDKRLTTLPGSNKATCIMATLRNDSGMAVDVFDLSFTLTGSGADPELPGYVLYYSLTGNAGDWVRIGNFGTPGPVTSTIQLAGSWADGAILHVLWADDNANGATDNWYGIDDLIIAPPTAGGYASWQSTNGATGQTLDQDHDNDGVPNGIEYFLGGNTNTTGITALPGISYTGGALSVTWTKAAGYTGAYGTDFVAETSDALTGDWAPEALAPAGNVTITGNDVTYTFPTPLGARKFARLKVTGP
ncbi:MAG: autotransporter-associated beta strand repeat-containing protein, partial [Verrucomicrobia bacterium]|nr:autotransporter-associated beta strand repeat-containing protein [Verrucomicrobiota bacterium]